MSWPNHVLRYVTQAPDTVLLRHREGVVFPTHLSLGEGSLGKGHDVVGMEGAPRALNRFVGRIGLRGLAHLNRLARPRVACDVLLCHVGPCCAQSSNHQEGMPVEPRKTLDELLPFSAVVTVRFMQTI